VLMPDHIHLFVARFDDGITLSAWVKSLKNSLSKVLRQQKIPSPHWQKDFFDHVLRSNESYDEKWHYVLQNPVRADLVSRSEDWPHQGEIHSLECRRS
jgi:REP-associated tyrosine transposase